MAAAAPLARAAESDVTAFRSEIIPFETADLPQRAFLSGGPTTTARIAATAEVTEFLVEVLKPR